MNHFKTTESKGSNLNLIQNAMPDTFCNHYSVIKKCIENAQSIDVAVSYIKLSGINVLFDCLKSGKKMRLLCSVDMGITDLEALRKLIEVGAHVKVCRLQRGTFHSKMWIFNSGSEWQCLIGSSNLTYSAMFDNVETGILIGTNEENNSNFIAQVRRYFDDLWDSSENVNNDMIEEWSQKAIIRKELEHRAKSVKHSPDNAMPVMFDFVKGWIDLGCKEIQQGIKDKIWRGWYIVPDHGYINDDLMNRLFHICSVIKENNGAIDISNHALAYPYFQKILDITTAKLKRPNHKTSERGLFIRQEKNYLIKLGFAFHPNKLNKKADKDHLLLTPLGEMLSVCPMVLSQKDVYTRSMENFMWNGLRLLSFVQSVISQLGGEIHFDEFNYFVSHACNAEECETIVNLVRLYRALDAHKKSKFDSDVKDYFCEKLEPTAQNVLGNYKKNTKHTISAIGWSAGFEYDEKMSLYKISSE